MMMNWIYYIYLFVCVSQFPIFISLSSSHINIKYQQLDIISPLFASSSVNNNNSSSLSLINNNNDADHDNQNNDTLLPLSVVLPPPTSHIPKKSKQEEINNYYSITTKEEDVELQAGMCSILAVLFAVFFMCITSIDDEFFVLGQSDADIPDAKVHKTIEIIRVIFWLFVWNQAHVINVFVLAFKHDNLKHHHMPIVPQDLTISCISRTFALWCSCRTALGDKGSLCHRAGCIGLYVIWLVQLAHASQCGGLLIAGQVFLDFILVFGHMYDMHTTSMVVLNCRLFFVACSSTWIHVAAWLTLFESSASS